ncbi:MAG TPA: hypothetical protein VFM95_07255 [Microcella sp.]|nr:hypothetical protein [Microcella sp.]
MTHHEENRPGAAPNDNRTGQDAQVERRIARLLLWYPRAWRREHGEVLRADLREDAARRGRAAVGAGVVARTAVHGTAARLSPRLMVAAAIAATVIAVLASIAQFAGFDGAVNAPGVVDVAVWVAAVGSGSLLFLVLAAGLRRGAWVSDGVALALPLLGAAWIATTLVGLASWQRGFDELNRGVPTTSFSDAWPLIAALGVALGATITSMIGLSYARANGITRGVAVLIAAIAGAVAATFASVAAISPPVLAIVSAGILIVVAVGARASRAATTYASSSDDGEREPGVMAPRAVSSSSAATTRIRVALLVVTALASSLGVVTAMTGSLWLPGRDSTQAMGAGITIGLFSAVPLCAAVALGAVHRPSWRRAWFVPTSVFMVSLAIYGSGYAWFADGSLIFLMVALSAAVGGLAVALWAAPRLADHGVASSGLAATAAGIMYAFVLGIGMPPLATFALPIVATVLATVLIRRQRRGQGRPVASRRRTESPGRSWARRSRASSVTTAITG